MVTLDKALEILLDSAIQMETETIPFGKSLNRILAMDIRADRDMPPFNKSAMDGFACRREDLSMDLKVIETIPAGKMPENRIEKGQCSQIMTGSMIPEGADCVIKVEESSEIAAGIIRFTGQNTKNNISWQGEDVGEKDVVLRQGIRIGAAEIAVMAAMGATELLVYKSVRLGIISTGDELTEPTQKPSPSQIRNSNAYQLIAQAKQMGLDATYYGIAPDNEEKTFQILTRAMSEMDVILLTGGISMGNYDFVPSIMQRAGLEIRFQKIAVQPGKPTIFGTKGHIRVIGLPGNPVSSFVHFELLIKPLLYRTMGHNYTPLNLQLPMHSKYERKRSGILSVFPVSINEQSEVVPVEYHGSAHIIGLTNADGLSFIEPDKTIIEKGEYVYLRLI